MARGSYVRAASQPWGPFSPPVQAYTAPAEKQQSLLSPSHPFYCPYVHPELAAFDSARSCPTEVVSVSGGAGNDGIDQLIRVSFCQAELP